MAGQLQADQETREVPIVFLTARSEPQEVARGFELGAVDYILKPFNPLELAPRIREVLKLDRSEREVKRRSKMSE